MKPRGSLPAPLVIALIPALPLVAVLFWFSLVLGAFYTMAEDMAGTVMELYDDLRDQWRSR